MWRVIRGFTSLLSGRVLRLLLTLVITPVLVRLLGSANYGDYAFIMSVFTLLMITANAGIDGGLRKYLVEDRAEDDWLESVFGFYARTALLTVAVVVLAVLIGINYSLLDAFVEPSLQSSLLLVAGLVVFSQVFRICRSGLTALHFEHYAELLSVAQQAVFGVVAVALLYVGLGVDGVILGHVVATGIVALGGVYLIHPRISLTSVFVSAPESVSRRGLLTYNLLFVLLNYLFTSLYHVDILLLQPAVGSRATGYYKAALVVAEFLWFVPLVFQGLFQYAGSEWWTKNQIQRINIVSSRATRYIALFSALLSIGLLAVGDTFVTLYFGPEFEQSMLPLYILLPGAFFMAVARPIHAIAGSKDRASLTVLIYVTGVAAVLNLALNLILIPRYGMAGAAVATSIGYGSMLGLDVLAARRVGFNPTADLRLWRVLATIAISTPLIVGFAAAIPHSFAALMLTPPVGFAVFAGISFLTGAVTREEVRDLVNRLPNSEAVPFLDII